MYVRVRKDDVARRVPAARLILRFAARLAPENKELCPTFLNSRLFVLSRGIFYVASPSLAGASNFFRISIKILARDFRGLELKFRGGEDLCVFVDVRGRFSLIIQIFLILFERQLVFSFKKNSNHINDRLDAVNNCPLGGVAIFLHILRRFL